MTLYVVHAPQIAPLAQRLAGQLVQEWSSGGATALDQTCIVVPHGSMETWLKLSLARRLGIATDLKFLRVEQGLWELLASTDGNARPKQLDVPTSARLILALLMSPEVREAPEMAPVWRYIGGSSHKEWEPQSQRKAWQLAAKLAALFADYEVHRADMILSWIRGEPIPTGAGDEVQEWQQFLYDALFKPGGWRDVALPDHFTLPQYWERNKSTMTQKAAPRDAPLTWFSVGNMARYHFDILCALAKHQDIYFYLPIPSIEQESSGQLLRLWGLPARQTAEMLTACAGTVDISATPELPDSKQASLLGHVQSLVGSVSVSTKLEQDVSLQIWACPGDQREVETVFNSLLYHLEQDKSLQLTDIGILATDMNRYRPIIDRVFSGRKVSIPYTVADGGNATRSSYANGVQALLALIGSEYSRPEMFAVLANPCFLAAINADADMVELWRNWTVSLGVFRGYTHPEEEPVSGEMVSSDYRGEVHTWRAALRRMRLGRIMTAQFRLPADGVPLDFRGVIPYADMEMHGTAFDRFSYAIELLYHTTNTLAEKELCSCQEWSELLSAFFETTLKVPDTASEEETVRQGALRSLRSLRMLEQCFLDGVTLDFVRRHVQESLKNISASAGRPLLDGVTVGTLKGLRSVPFRQIYVLGLSEGQFPGQNERSTLDLRRQTPRPGDLGTSDLNRQLFLDALMSATEGIFLTYSNRDLEKDSEVGHCSLLYQLESFVEGECLPPGTRFKEGTAPLVGRSRTYLNSQKPGPCEPLCNYDSQDRLIALAQMPDLPEQAAHRLAQYKEQSLLDSALPVATAVEAISKVRVKELVEFLMNPAQAILRQRLGLKDDEIDERDAQADEPFFSEFPVDYRLVVEFQQRYIADVLRSGQAPEQAGPLFRAVYGDAFLRSQTPGGVFAQLDGNHFEELAATAVDGAKGLKELLETLREHRCEGVSLGAGRTAGVRRFAPPIFEVDGKPVVLEGELPLLWHAPQELHSIICTSSKQVENLDPNTKGRWHLIKHVLEPLLTYLSLLCASEKDGQGVSPQSLAEERTLVLHLTWPKGVCKARFRVKQDEASQYMQMLTQEYLRPCRQLDDLPLKTVCGKDALWPLLDDKPGENGRDQIDSYCEQLKVAIEDDSAAMFFKDHDRMELLQLSDHLRVPTEARAMVQERLMPLYKWRILEEKTEAKA